MHVVQGGKPAATPATRFRAIQAERLSWRMLRRYSNTAPQRSQTYRSHRSEASPPIVKWMEVKAVAQDAHWRSS